MTLAAEIKLTDFMDRLEKIECEGMKAAARPDPAAIPDA
jgi:hypothetical protein